MSWGRKDYLFQTPVHLPDGREKPFGDLTREEMHAFMDAVEREDPQAVFDASLLRLRAFALSIEEAAPTRFTL
jgi:hypothetical protein